SRAREAPLLRDRPEHLQLSYVHRRAITESDGSDLPRASGLYITKLDSDSEAGARLRMAFSCTEGAALPDVLSACFDAPRAEPAACPAAQAVRVGPRLNLLAERRLSTREMEGWTARRLSLLFPGAGGVSAFRRTLNALV